MSPSGKAQIFPFRGNWTSVKISAVSLLKFVGMENNEELPEADFE